MPAPAAPVSAPASPARRRRWLGLAAVALLALAARAAAWHFFIAPRAAASPFAPFWFPDSAQIWDLASALADGRYETADHLRAWRMPGAPSFFAAARGLAALVGAAPLTAARLANVLLDVGNVLLVWLLARRVFSPAAGWLAAVVAAVYPFHVLLAPLVLADALAHAAVLLTALALHACREALLGRGGAGEKAAGESAPGATGGAGRRPDWRLAGLALGAALGLAVYAKASLALLCLPAWLWLLWQTAGTGDWRLRRRAFAQCGLAAAALALALGGWWARNWRAFHEAVPLTTMGGFTLWEGSGPGADGGPNHGKVKFPGEWEALRRELAAGGPPTLETAADRLLKRESVAVLRTDPLRALRLSWEKFRRTWNVVPNWAGAGHWAYAVATVCSYLPVMLFALAGAYAFRRRRQEVWLLLVPALYLAGVHSVFMGSLRYRAPAEGCLIALAAGAAVWGKGLLTQRAQRKEAQGRKGLKGEDKI